MASGSADAAAVATAVVVAPVAARRSIVMRVRSDDRGMEHTTWAPDDAGTDAHAGPAAIVWEPSTTATVTVSSAPLTTSSSPSAKGVIPAAATSRNSLVAAFQPTVKSGETAWAAPKGTPTRTEPTRADEAMRARGRMGPGSPLVHGVSTRAAACGARWDPSTHGSPHDASNICAALAAVRSSSPGITWA